MKLILHNLILCHNTGFKNGIIDQKMNKKNLKN